MSEKLPRLEGATHRARATGEPVKAVRWLKDGDHKAVERYPIEKRDYKGLLVVDPKHKFALRFGDWVIEDAEGRLYVVDGQPRQRTRFVDLGDEMFQREVETVPSLFEEQYVPIEPEQQEVAV